MLTKNTANGSFFFLVHNRNHVRIFSTAARLLTAQRVNLQFVDIDAPYTAASARDEMARSGLAWLSLRDVAGILKQGDVMVVGCDWGPPWLVECLAAGRRTGATVVGVVDGCRFGEPIRYRGVDRLMGWGPSSTRLFDVPVSVVGSPIIERAWRQQPRFDEPPYALINYKFPFYLPVGREEWIGAAINACDSVGIAYRVSRHPSDTTDELGLPIEQIGFRELLFGASVLISRPSTTIFEAIAAGVPVVHFPTQDEPLVEFAEPMGAFDTALVPEDLPPLIRRALAMRSECRERSRSFLSEHVSMEIGRTSNERLAEVLLDIGVRPSALGE